MSLTLHGHQVLLIATLVFAAAVLTPNWYTSPDGTVAVDVFQICSVQSSFRSCDWTLAANSSNPTLNRIKLIYPTLIASFAIACAGTSLIALLFGSWYIHRFSRENDTKWLLIVTIVTALLSFLFSCAVWTIMLTTNLQQRMLTTADVRLRDLGFSFWINIGASGLYFYVLFIHLLAVCHDS